MTAEIVCADNSGRMWVRLGDLDAHRLGSGVAEPAHRVQDDLPLRRHPQAFVVQRLAQRDSVTEVDETARIFPWSIR